MWKPVRSDFTPTHHRCARVITLVNTLLTGNVTTAVPIYGFRHGSACVVSS